MPITTPGPGGDHGPLARRVANIERDLSKFSPMRILTADEFGRPKRFTVLAARLGPGKEEAAAVGAFWGLYVDGGDTYLQGGTVSGGSGTKTIEDIKVLDGRTGSGSLEGKILWVAVTVNGVANDGVLLPGANVVSATCSATSTAGTEVPNNTLPTATSPNGKNVFVEVGRWNAEGFVPSQPGNIQITFCPGSFVILR